MEPHLPTTDRLAKRRRRDEEPMDVDWLKQKAIDYAARWETTEHGLAKLLERKIGERCERTSEDSEVVRALIPEVVETLAERNFVDDHRAASQLFQRLERQGRSLATIRARLLAKGVPEAMVVELTQDQGADTNKRELRAAWKTARKRRIGPHCPDPARRAKDRNRHLGILARQGFTSEVAYQVVDAEEAPKEEL